MKRTDFNSGWRYGEQGQEKRAVTLPHDAMLLSGRDQDAPGKSAGAYYKGGIYEYEKIFKMPAEWNGRQIYLQFEGVYRNTGVKINGHEAGGADYGYIPFFVNAGKWLQCGKENRIEVIADNSEQPNSRWYTGGGIYRPVWLWTGEGACILPEGVKVTTVSCRPARIRVEISSTAAAANAAAFVLIRRENTPVASAEIGVNGNGTGQAEIDIPDAELWSDETPNLYQCFVKLSQNGIMCDEAETVFGIRKITWSSQGLFINGRSVLLRGGCVHHDNGILGAASYEESEWRRVRMLKEAGYNAVRVSHNPACGAMLDACDAYGLYVIDETWDMWYQHKSKYDYADHFPENYQSDIHSMVNRDYNHPSVILYSIGNEVSEPASEKGVKLAEEIVACFHELDGTRAVTGGINLMIISRSAKGNGIYKEEGGRDSSAEKKTRNMSSTMFNLMTSMVGTGMNRMANSKKADQVTSPVLGLLDIAGYNYASGRYRLEGKAHPDRVIFGSETFPQDIAKNWEMVEKYPYLIGDFMWTAWDYLGEAGLGAWACTEDGKGFDKPYPWTLADCGAFDILGSPNAELYWAKAAWKRLDRPAITVQPVNRSGVRPAKAVWRGTNAIPSWSFAGCCGSRAIVEVYTSAASVELFINNKRIGKKKVKECRAVFRTVYAPGTVKAAAYGRDGEKLGESMLVSATGAVTITAEVTDEKRKDSRIRYVDIALKGENGVVECNRDAVLKATVKGGELLGFGSANPRTEESFLTGVYRTYYGRAQAVVRLHDKETCTLTLRMESTLRADGIFRADGMLRAEDILYADGTLQTEGMPECLVTISGGQL